MHTGDLGGWVFIYVGVRGAHPNLPRYLSYSILGLLMREGKLAREGSSKRHVAQVS